MILANGGTLHKINRMLLADKKGAYMKEWT